MSKDIQSVKQRFGIIGNSPGINYALNVALRVASTNLTVLITGESGVGKEIFSQIIHKYSSRKHNPFIAVNCGAIPEGTIDSELFGHEKGSFTGAHEARKGYFETVNGGTIFLDEVGELPIGTQARLLRVLETGEFIKVGSSKVLKTDVRIVAATNVELLEQVRRGKFREDLYYRLSTVPIIVPPLRERKEDIYLLFRRFATDFAEKYRTPGIQLDEEAREQLQKYPWPGNIRELKNTVEQLSVLATDKVIGGEDLKQYIPGLTKSNLPALASEVNPQNSEYSERELLYKVLFDMKKDLTELKQFVLQMAKSGDFNGEVPIPSALLGESQIIPPPEKTLPEKAPIIIDEAASYVEESFEESLSIADKEKELIAKALDKHKGKRKDAALDLGISERTLYRKIKEYEINE